ncbi:RNase H-like domain found in reverse transcriptase [Popillia japonica]|uniref:RNase H-like domain found in reverse transcriptase n=1 Tax=Popillia japonica TaxID=7064 RepID=A0AAW1JZA1_POPJA
MYSAKTESIQTRTRKRPYSIFSKDGIYPDPDKKKAILKVEHPKTPTDVRSFLGMVNYLGKFIPRLASHTRHLRELTLKNAEWKWNTEHQTEFKTIKQLINDADKITYFDTGKKTHLHVDAGPNGLGALLSQEDNNVFYVVAYGSRALNKTEMRYSQIEKEMLAAAWAMDHFKLYLLGNTFELYTDHKPLLHILQSLEQDRNEIQPDRKGDASCCLGHGSF